MKNKSYEVKLTNTFKKQYSRIKRNQNFKQEEFINLLKLLIENENLPSKYKNHPLNPKSKRHLGMSRAK